MKIIDLLNKIANGEEVPKIIKLDNNIYDYEPENKDYYNRSNLNYRYLFDEWFHISEVLNDEVSILEEDKKIPEKLPKWATTREDKEYTKQEEHILVVSQKINEIIDYLKSKGE